MIITNELKQILDVIFEANSKNGVHISLTTHSCGGKGLDVECIKLEDDNYKEYNGVKVVISPEDDTFLEHYILSADANGGVSVALEEGYEPQHTCNCGENGEHNCGDECSCHK